MKLYIKSLLLCKQHRFISAAQTYMNNELIFYISSLVIHTGFWTRDSNLQTSL